jgi:GT2 family glycosyltransferase
MTSATSTPGKLSQKAPDNPVRVSIISAVDDHPPDPQIWFKAMGHQTLPPEMYEILVMDASHVADYESPLAQFRATTTDKERAARISYHRVERGGRAQALNRGLELATGEVIVFLGDDYVPSVNFAEVHLQFHETHPEIEAVGVGGAIMIPELRRPFAVWIEESGQLYGVPFRADMTEIHKEFFYVGNASLKRTLLEKAGRFNEEFAHHAWDDFEFSRRLLAAGMKVHYLPAARVAHHHDIDLAERRRAMFQSGAAARVYLSHFPGPHPWQAVLSLPPWRHWWRILKSRVRLALTGSDNALIAWWQASLDAAFARGYRIGSRRDGAH